MLTLVYLSYFRKYGIVINFPLERTLLWSVIFLGSGDIVFRFSFDCFSLVNLFKKRLPFPQFWDSNSLFILEYLCQPLKNILGVPAF